MRVLFTTQIGSGHWRPLAPFARALEAAGHEVAFGTTPIGCTIIAGHGFRCFPIGDDDWQDSSRRPQPAAPEQSVAVTLNLFLPRAERNLPELLAVCRIWQPDLIVREQTEFAGCLAAEVLELPHATVQVSAFRGRSFDQIFAEAIGRLRTAAGLPPDPDLAMLYRYLLLAPFPPRYQDPAVPLPPTVRHVRHISFDHLEPPERPPGLDDEVMTFPDAQRASRPVVYATLGTAYNRTPGVFTAILEGLRGEPVNLVATVNLNQNPAEFGPQPPHVHIARYVPQSLLFPQCDLVITHGGSGTIRAAIDHGLPMVIIPIAADQPDNAYRCAALGLARVITQEARTPEAIRAAVRSVLADPNYRANATQLRDEMRALPGPDSVVDVLERLACERQPLTR
jgi:UDP:flavonoid glycosyltransferase YjiC (YdhE family)